MNATVVLFPLYLNKLFKSNSSTKYKVLKSLLSEDHHSDPLVLLGPLRAERTSARVLQAGGFGLPSLRGTLRLLSAVKTRQTLRMGPAGGGTGPGPGPGGAAALGHPLDGEVSPHGCRIRVNPGLNWSGSWREF